MTIKIGRSPEGKWLHIEDKQTVATFETREEAIAALNVPAKEKKEGCRHGGLGGEECALGPESLNEGWFGRRCQDCGIFILRGGRQIPVWTYMGGFGITLFLTERPI